MITLMILGAVLVAVLIAIIAWMAVKEAKPKEAKSKESEDIAPIRFTCRWNPNFKMNECRPAADGEYHTLQECRMLCPTHPRHGHVQLVQVPRWGLRPIRFRRR